MMSSPWTTPPLLTVGRKSAGFSWCTRSCDLPQDLHLKEDECDIQTKTYFSLIGGREMRAYISIWRENWQICHMVIPLIPLLCSKTKKDASTSTQTSGITCLCHLASIKNYILRLNDNKSLIKREALPPSVLIHAHQYTWKPEDHWTRHKFALECFMKVLKKTKHLKLESFIIN